MYCTFTMELKVHSPETLYRAAVTRLADESPGQDPVELLGTPEEPDIEGCLVMLLDPSTLAGCDIGESSAEVFPDLDP